MWQGLKLVLKLLIVGICLGGGILLVSWTKYPEHFPLRIIEIREEVTRVNPEELKSLIAPHTEKGFFGLEVETLQNLISQHPWVEKVSIRRIWPDRIAISIQEKIPQALWGDNGVLSTEGDIFYPDKSSIPEGLPLFVGPLLRAKEMQQEYFVLLEMLGPLGLKIDNLTLSEEGAWQMRLNNGITVILGKTALDERMGRFLLIYQKLEDKSHNIEYLDLRYTNGMAIGWKNAGPMVQSTDQSVP